MPTSTDPGADGYEAFYREFDSPLMRALRREAYGEDIGQHSWVSADELRGDIQRLRLTSTSRLLDLGCGPCGPLTFLVAATRCRGTGLELSPTALELGQKRAAELGIESLITLQFHDLNQPLPFAAASFDTVISLDVVLHLRDRGRFFREVARVLAPGGRFLLTDAGVVTGEVSDEEVRRRSIHGDTQLVAAGSNERRLESAGLRLLEIEDRTTSVLRNATGRLTAPRAHRDELEQLSSAPAVAILQDYFETLIDLAQRQTVSRFLYLLEIPATTMSIAAIVET